MNPFWINFFYFHYIIIVEIHFIKNISPDQGWARPSCRLYVAAPINGGGQAHDKESGVNLASQIYPPLKKPVPSVQKKVGDTFIKLY